MTVSSASALFAWGSGIDGRLGHGSNKDKREHMRVENVSMEKDGEIVVKEQDGMKIVGTHAVTGETHSCGVIDDGGLYTWGNGQDGAWEPLFCVYTVCFTVCVHSVCIHTSGPGLCAWVCECTCIHEEHWKKCSVLAT